MGTLGLAEKYCEQLDYCASQYPESKVLRKIVDFDKSMTMKMAYSWRFMKYFFTRKT